jgi:hypothetical protein
VHFSKGLFSFNIFKNKKWTDLKNKKKDQRLLSGSLHILCRETPTPESQSSCHGQRKARSCILERPSW